MKYSKIIPSPNNLPINPTDAASTSLKMMVSAWSEYKKVAEAESTKRTEIAAWKEVNITKINAQKEILEQYLAETFKERATTIKEMFQRLDRGIDEGNPDLINATLGGIIEMARISPLKEATKLIAAINNPDVQSIEI